jgi:hypothetical protein
MKGHNMVSLADMARFRADHKLAILPVALGDYVKLSPHLYTAKRIPDKAMRDALRATRGYVTDVTREMKSPHIVWATITPSDGPYTGSGMTYRAKSVEFVRVKRPRA